MMMMRGQGGSAIIDPHPAKEAEAVGHQSTLLGADRMDSSRGSPRRLFTVLIGIRESI